jgi:oxaloacetate decarboxylase beta subunit
MTGHDVLSLFQGLQTLVDAPPVLMAARIGFIILGMLLVYLGKKGVLEPLLMVPMGLGMSAVNAGVLVLDTGKTGTLFLDPLVTNQEQLFTLLQIDFLQPIYTLMFSNGLIACFVFMGIGVLLDVGYVLARPFLSMFIAICAELGTVAVFPIAVVLGFSYNDAASVAMIGCADGPMVLYTSLMLSKDLFVPIGVVAYLYLGLTYGGYPYLIKFLVPAKLRALPMVEKKVLVVTSAEKLAFAVVGCTVLCLLFPVAAPLFFSLFLGVAVREAGLHYFVDFVGGPLLYGSTLFLGLTLGILCEAATILSPKVLLLLILGIVALLLSGIGGIVGGYIVYIVSGRKFNPVIGIAGVSCVPTTAKVAQKTVSAVAPNVVILPIALGANISGVITSAILTGIYVTIIPHLNNLIK